MPSEADVSAYYAAAKREGTVVWWTAHYAQSAAESVRDAFKAKYPGVEVQFIRQTAQVIYQRLTQNLKSNVHEVDVFASTDEAHYAALKKQNVLAEYLPGDINKIPSALQHLDPEGTYYLGALGFVLINYNTKIQPAHRWTQLGDSRFKGQVTLGHPGFSGYVGNWVLAMNDKYGWDYFKNLAAGNPKIGRSVNDTVTDIVAGERMIGAGPDNYSLEKKAAGNAINIVYPEDDAILIASPVAVMKDAPHPNAARLFENFMYSREYSLALLKTYNYPLRTDVAPANGVRLDQVHWHRNKVERLASGIPEMVAKWRETFGV
ncbi:MAG: extracellular solute-binding protein [Candidatus Eremiobacteraeota bacterium]|nr:extracellular solute-binding protein [Candidatus Eremiobacteraeota bacterium]MBV8354139.1 extracellular solute-binding protein [Candidatus Eremiobacteraeota bacterium]